MSKYSDDTLNKLRGFIEVNGDGLPTREQWNKILDLINSVPKERGLTIMEVGGHPESLREYQPLRNDLTTFFNSDASDGYCGLFDKTHDEDWQIDDEGNATYVGDIRLNNSFDVDDIIELDFSSPSLEDSKLCNMDSVTIGYEVDDGAHDDRSNRDD